MLAKAANKLFTREAPDTFVGESQPTSINGTMEDQLKLNLAVTNLNNRLSSVCNDFKMLHKDIAQKFLAITAQLSFATSSATSDQTSARNANNDAVGQLLQSTPCVQQHLSHAKVVSTDVVKSSVTQVIEEQREVHNLTSTIVAYGFPGNKSDDYSELVSVFNYVHCRSEIVLLKARCF